eukprot:2091535-Amphidinium_carterae.1
MKSFALRHHAYCISRALTSCSRCSSAQSVQTISACSLCLRSPYINVLLHLVELVPTLVTVLCQSLLFDLTSKTSDCFAGKMANTAK